MWPHVERLLRFEPFLADPARTDELKRYRVATRRLRSALRLFAPAFPRRDVSSMRDALGDVGRAAGLVRDLDVRLADLKAWAVSDGGETLTEVGPLREAWQAERASLSVALLERLEARRHPRLIRELVDLVEGRTGATAVGGRALRDSAASRGTRRRT